MGDGGNVLVVVVEGGVIYIDVGYLFGVVCG